MGTKFDTAIMDKVLDLEARMLVMEKFSTAQLTVNKTQIEINEALEALAIHLVEEQT